MFFHAGCYKDSAPPEHDLFGFIDEQSLFTTSSDESESETTPNIASAPTL
jgi:hypothetical protein